MSMTNTTRAKPSKSPSATVKAATPRRSRSPRAADLEARQAIEMQETRPLETPESPSKVAEIQPVHKPKKPKLIRHSFKIPHDEYAVFDDLKSRSLGMGLAVKKSEIVRAGLMSLNALSDKKLVALLGKVDKVKVARSSE